MTDHMYNIVSFSGFGAEVSAGYYMAQVGRTMGIQVAYK